MSPILPRLWPLLSRWRGYRYGPHVANGEVNCSTLTAHVLRDAYGREAITPEVWRGMQILDHARPWSPVEDVAAAVETDPCLPYYGPHQPAAGRLHLCQGWRYLTGEGVGPGSQGHAWLWVALGGWDGVVIESSGVGPRVWDGAGKRPLREVLSPDGELKAALYPLDWSTRAERWTDGVAFVALP